MFTINRNATEIGGTSNSLAATIIFPQRVRPVYNQIHHLV